MTRIEEGTLADFQQHTENANKGTARGRGVIEQSVSKHGAGRSLLADKNRTFIAGNHAAEVLAEAGIENTIEVHTDGTKVVVVVRDDLDLNDPDNAAARELAIYDNRASELGLAWEASVLLAQMEESEDVRKLFTPGEAAKLMQAAEGQGKQYQLIPLLFAPDELEAMQGVWDEVARGAHGGQSEWWIARMADYDRIMNGVGDVMNSNSRQLRYVHQAILFLVKFWRKHRNDGGTNE